MSRREGSLNAVSADMVQLLPHLAPVIFPNPHIRKVLPLLINIWEPLLLYGARWENRRNRGHKETHGRLRLNLRRSTPGGCHTRLKVPGVKPPEHPALCGH